MGLRSKMKRQSHVDQLRLYLREGLGWMQAYGDGSQKVAMVAQVGWPHERARILAWFLEVREYAAGLGDPLDDLQVKYDGEPSDLMPAVERDVRRLQETTRRLEQDG